MIEALILAGRAKTSLGHYSESCIIFGTALHYCIQHPIVGYAHLPAVFNNMAISLDYSGQYDKALASYFLALTLAEGDKNGNQHVEKIYCNIAGVMFHKLSITEAMRWYRRAERLARRNSSYDYLGLILFNEAGPYYQLGLQTRKSPYSDTAKQLLTEALAIAKNKNDTLLQNDVLVRLSMPALCDNNAATSLKYLAQARRLMPRERNIAKLCINLSLTGDVYHGMKQYKTAIGYYNQALELATTHQNLQLIQSLQQNLSATWLALGDFKQAFWHRIYLEGLNDSLMSQSILQNINDLNLKYKTAEKDKELARQDLTIVSQQKRIATRNFTVALSLGMMSVILLLAFIRYRIYRQHQKSQEHRIALLEREKHIELLRGIMKGEEKERIRLARELHDGIGGMLTTANFSLNRMAMTDHAGEKQFKNVQRMVQDIAAEVRKAAHNLMPDVLIHHGLVEGLLNYCDTINQTGQLQVSVSTLGNLQLLEKSTELLLYRIAQELIQNAVKHAQASYVVLQLVQRNRQISLSVEDDGRGFNAEEYTGGYGLQNLIYRVQAMQGHISINTTPEKGTNIYIEFDLDKLAELA